MNAAQTGGKLETYDPMSAIGGHAIALVGYDPNIFIARNSWGRHLGGRRLRLCLECLCGGGLHRSLRRVPGLSLLAAIAQKKSAAHAVGMVGARCGVSGEES